MCNSSSVQIHEQSRSATPTPKKPCAALNAKPRSIMNELSYELIEQTGAAPIKMFTRRVPVEDEARKQLLGLARLPVVWPFVAAMPDVHLAIGGTVGSVVPTRGAIIPAAVGLDIGCGMIAARTSLVAADLPDNLGPLKYRQFKRPFRPGWRVGGGRASAGFGRFWARIGRL